VEIETTDLKVYKSLNLDACSKVISGYFFGLRPPRPIRTTNSLFLIVKVFAPKLVKLELILCFIESMAVKIPTKAVIPMAMISMVRIDLSKLLLIALSAILMFSLNTFSVQCIGLLQVN